MGELTKKASLSLLSLVLTCVFFELTLRAVPGFILPEVVEQELKRFNNSGPIVYDRRSFRRIVPNFDSNVESAPPAEKRKYHVRTISLDESDFGFRDDGIDHKDIVVAIGDSFTFGPGVSDSFVWTEVLERKTGIDVVNMGVSGASNFESERILQNHALALNPRLILWGIFPGNDFTDNVTYAKWKTRRAPFIRDFFNQHSRLIYVIRVMVKLLKQSKSSSTGARANGKANLKSSYELSSALSKGLGMTMSIIRNTKKLLAETSTDLAIIIFVNDSQDTWVRRDILTATQRLQEFLAEEDIPFRRIWPCLDGEYHPQDCVIRKNGGDGGHWNEKGHSVGAAKIAKFLRELGYLKDPPAPLATPNLK